MPLFRSLFLHSCLILITVLVFVIIIVRVKDMGVFIENHYISLRLVIIDFVDIMQAKRLNFSLFFVR